MRCGWIFRWLNCRFKGLGRQSALLRIKSRSGSKKEKASQLANWLAFSWLSGFSAFRN